jgi:branched-chain amino acid transport system substrate-binding protein
LGALALILVFGGRAWAADEIKVGLLYPLTGIYAAPGKQDVEGVTLAFEEVGNQIGGRKVVLVVEDDEAKPEVALAKGKKLVESDRVQVLMGVIWSPNAMALRGYVHEHKVPLVLSEAAVRPITQEAGSPYVFRASFASGQMTYPFGNYACGKLAYRKVVVIAFDSVFGRDETDFFEAGCKKAGGAVLEKIYAPIETPVRAYFAHPAGQSRRVWVSGPARRRAFLKQYSDFGMKQKCRCLAWP